MNERFILTNYSGDLSVIDTGHELIEEEGNLELFYIGFNSKEDAKHIEQELKPIIRILNEKDKKEKKVYKFFKNYLNEIREEIEYETYSEMDKMLNILISD